jgi:hypothetical protein
MIVAEALGRGPERRRLLASQIEAARVARTPCGTLTGSAAHRDPSRDVPGRFTSSGATYILPFSHRHETIAA